MPNETNHQSTNPNPRENAEHGWMRCEHVGPFPFVREHLMQHTHNITTHGRVRSISTPRSVSTLSP